MRRRVLIIVNPAAGRSSRRSRRRLDRIVAALERRGCTIAVRYASAPGDAERLVREAEPDFEAIVAAGGDGTVNAVANGMADNPRPLAVLPFGTANVLARELCLPRRTEALAALIAAAPARPVWPGLIDGRLFLAMAGIGFDAAVVAAVDSRWKRRVGRLAFLWAICRCLIRYRRCELTIHADGVDYRAAALIAANGRFYAGPFVIAPAGDLGRPGLDLLLFRDDGRLAALRYLCALPLGLIPRLKSITSLRIRAAAVSACEPAPAHADGEVVPPSPGIIAVADRPLLLIAP